MPKSWYVVNFAPKILFTYLLSGLKVNHLKLTHTPNMVFSCKMRQLNAKLLTTSCICRYFLLAQSIVI